MKNIQSYKNNLWVNLLWILLLVSCKHAHDAEHKDEHAHETEEHETATMVSLNEAQLKTIGLQLGTLQTRSLSGTLKVNGVLDVPPQNLVTISIPYGGVIKHTDLLQGMKIRKGQLLATLEHPDYIQLQQDYLDQISQLNFMELELKRQEELQKEQVNATKTYQQAQSQYQSLKAKVEGLAHKLKLLNIAPKQLLQNGISTQVKLYAPIDGYVTQVPVNIGMYVNANDVICKLVDTRHLHAELTVFEKDVAYLKKGQKVRFSFNHEAAEKIATVYLIGKEIGEDRTIRVHCHLDKEDPNLLPGMYLKAIVETQSKGVLSLPAQAVVQANGKNYIFAAQGKKQIKDDSEYLFEMREVQVGLKDDAYVEIIADEHLTPNTSIVVEGAYDLLSKMNNSEDEGGHSH